MNDFVIVTDSSCDLPNDLVQKLELHVVPLAFIMGDKTYWNYPDNREMSPEDFYGRQKQGQMATTNAVNVGQATDVLEPILKQGKDLLVLAFSSGLSTTCNSFQIAATELGAQYPDRKVFVVDTLCASLGQGMLVAQAAQLRQQGKSMEEVRDWVEDNKLRQCHWFTVNDLFFLKKGGRVSAATAVVGTMLQIKPVMHVDNLGRLINVEKARGRRRSIERLAEKAEELGIDLANQTVFISHGDCIGDVRYLEERLHALGVKKTLVNYVGPVIGAHSGPGTLAMFFVGRER